LAGTVKKSFGTLIRELLTDPDSKPALRMGFEILYLILYYRRSPHFYFSRYLFKKERTNITDYFPDSYLHKIKPYFNDSDTRDILENKHYFNSYFSQFGINLPRIIMFNNRTLFIDGSKSIMVRNAAEFRILLEQLFGRNNNKPFFIKKTSWSYGGDQTYKLNRDQLDNDLAGIRTLYAEIVKSEYLFQETIEQHSEMDRLNPSCLNTMRIDTFMDKDGKTEIISAFLRTSIRNLHVDNISAGGCRIPIDIESGKLGKKGFSTFMTYGVTLPTQHPVSKTPFEDFTVPCFAEAKEMVIKAAGYIPSLRLVGWDIGIAENGPVLIEGNSNYNIPGNDLTYGGYRTNPVFGKVLQEYKELRKTKYN